MAYFGHSYLFDGTTWVSLRRGLNVVAEIERKP